MISKGFYFSSKTEKNKSDRDFKLIDDKIEFVIIDTRQQLANVSFHTINVGSDAISSVSVSRGLGVWIDANLTMSTHIRKAFIILGNSCPYLQPKSWFMSS